MFIDMITIAIRGKKVFIKEEILNGGMIPNITLMVKDLGMKSILI